MCYARNLGIEGPSMMGIASSMPTAGALLDRSARTSYRSPGIEEASFTLASPSRGQRGFAAQQREYLGKREFADGPMIRGRAAASPRSGRDLRRSGYWRGRTLMPANIFELGVRERTVMRGFNSSLGRHASYLVRSGKSRGRSEYRLQITVNPRKVNTPWQR
jgi:hypothetical protein